MTVNKSQGQSLKQVGVYSVKDFFSHGQLYVAASRVGNPQQLRILLINEEDHSKRIHMNNVVYQEILTRWLSNYYSTTAGHYFTGHQPMLDTKPYCINNHTFCDLFVIDEVSMMDRRAVEAAHQTFRNLRDCPSSPFEGKALFKMTHFITICTI